MLNLNHCKGPFAKNPDLIRHIIVHCSATPPGRDIGAKEIRAWHLAQGWKDIGYHFVIRLDGTVESGRPLSQPGAHCLGKNNSSLGICYVGGVLEDCKTPADTRTVAQKKALMNLIVELKKLFPKVDVRGHRDFAAKACPSFDATGEYKSFSLLKLLPVLLLVSVLTGCKSKKTAASQFDANTVVTSAVDADSFIKTVISDSIDLELIWPEISFVTPESCAVGVKAERIFIRKHIKKHQEQKDVVFHKDSLNSVAKVSEKESKSVESKGLPVKFYLILTGVLAAAFFLIKSIKSSKQKN